MGVGKGGAETSRSNNVKLDKYWGLREKRGTTCAEIRAGMKEVRHVPVDL